MDASAGHVSGLLKKCGLRLWEQGGLIRRVDHLGLRPLAYKMRTPATKKWHQMGRYVRLFVQASPPAIEDFQQRLKLDEEMVRHMCLKLSDTVAPIEERVRPPWKRNPGFDPALGEYIRRNSDLDFYAARTLLQKGKITEEEIQALGRHYVPDIPPAPVSPASPQSQSPPQPAPETRQQETRQDKPRSQDKAAASPRSSNQAGAAGAAGAAGGSRPKSPPPKSPKPASSKS